MFEETENNDAPMDAPAAAEEVSSDDTQPADAPATEGEAPAAEETPAAE